MAVKQRQQQQGGKGSSSISRLGKGAGEEGDGLGEGKAGSGVHHTYEVYEVAVPLTVRHAVWLHASWQAWRKSLCGGAFDSS
ncbi:unnamed protein product [Sphagnum jensenii]